MVTYKEWIPPLERPTERLSNRILPLENAAKKFCTYSFCKNTKYEKSDLK